ncbi:MAG TPA: hypothetical protein VN649_06830 [Ramlibacter sp.]|nr:hypothetical protein [Ramlibacter sp.]
MTERIVEGYRRAPSALNFMSRALRRSPGLARGAVIPPIAVQWNGVRIEPAQLEGFCRDTGLRADAGVPVLFPQVVGFRLQMALLTHPAYPLPIWTALQVRNRLVRHVHVEPGEILDLRTHVGEQRTVEKGIEVDLVSRLMRGPVCCWEGRTTFFHRGRFGMPSSLEPRAVSPDLSEVPPVDRFRMPGGGGWAFGKLTGDYNGIHCWNWYARRFGFPKAFPHPQRVAAMCQSRLAGPDTEAQTLDLWIKGPVFYGAEVGLNAVDGEEGLRFGLSLEGDARSALLGHWRAGAQPLSD